MPVSIRGNIDQHLDQLAQGDFESFMPSVGQGALALECREEDAVIRELLRIIAHKNPMRSLAAERVFLLDLGELNMSASGAYAFINQGEQIVLTVMFCGLQGCPGYLRREFIGDNGQLLGKLAAQTIKRQVLYR